MREAIFNHSQRHIMLLIPLLVLEEYDALTQNLLA